MQPILGLVEHDAGRLLEHIVRHLETVEHPGDAERDHQKQVEAAPGQPVHPGRHVGAHQPRPGAARRIDAEFANWPKFASWTASFRARMTLLRGLGAYALALTAATGEEFTVRTNPNWRRPAGIKPV